MSVNTSVVNGLPMQSDSGMSDRAKERSTVTHMQRTACNTTEKQFSVQLPEPVYQVWRCWPSGGGDPVNRSRQVKVY